jgi:hypothetical protein
MDDKFYDRCIACYYSDVPLLKCNRCVYKICRGCILDLSKVKLKLCKDNECRYDYLTNDEEFHCYVCDIDKKMTLTFNCPTCTLVRDYTIDTFENEMKKNVMKKGMKKFNSDESDLEGFFVAFFTIMDLDTGDIELLSFRGNDKSIVI